MIISEYENESKLLENEIKKFGRTPKKIKVERGEYKDVYSSNGGDTFPVKEVPATFMKAEGKKRTLMTETGISSS